ncbi:unnamed protein product [Closterium sp. NIES-54]
MSTYTLTDVMYIRQLEEKLNHIRMGEHESATDYCNSARRILGDMRMARVDYWTISYITHMVKELPRSYNLMRWMLAMPGVRDSLNEDTLTSHTIKDNVQEAKRPTEVLPQPNYVAPTKQGR